MFSLVIIAFFTYVAWCEFKKTDFFKALCQSARRACFKTKVKKLKLSVFEQICSCF